MIFLQHKKRGDISETLFNNIVPMIGSLCVTIGASWVTRHPPAFDNESARDMLIYCNYK